MDESREAACLLACRRFLETGVRVTEIGGSASGRNPAMAMASGGGNVVEVGVKNISA